MSEIPCPICRSPAVPAGIKPGARAGRTFKLRRCTRCGFAFVENPWTEYDQIYNEAYYRGQGPDPLIDYAFEFEHPEVTVRNYEWLGWDRLIHSLRPSPIKWLDFGCGCGVLVRYLQSRRRDQVMGFDTGTWTEKARQSGVNILNEAELDAQEGTFDVVTAIDVIEHVVDPLEMLRHMRRLLKPGGLLVALTQNAEIAPKNFATWSYVRPEIHVSFFTPQAMAEAMRQCGFEPFLPGRLPGWSDILHSRILKSVRVKRMSRLEKLLPWGLLGALADRRLKMNAVPYGRAV